MRARGWIVLGAAGALLAITGLPASYLLFHHPSGLSAAIFQSSSTAAPPVDNQTHLYVLDGWGGVHPVGVSPELAASASWPTKDIAYSLALFPDGSGGYVMDGWGKLHSVGSAPDLDSGVYWPHWIGAREIVMAPWSSSRVPAGYLLDADGGIHPFGGAPLVHGNKTWPSQGIARGIVLMPSSTPDSVQGYTLDGYGGIHPFGGARPIIAGSRFPGDVARGIVLTSGLNAMLVQGYTLDYSGGLHPFGGAPAMNSAMWPGEDMADSIVAWTAAPASQPGGWLLDRHGDVHVWGSAPVLKPSKTWPGWDIARGLAGAGSGGGSTERLILEAEPIKDGWGLYYNQRDIRWANDNVGPAPYAIWKIGCLLTDVAMVYTHFGYTSVTPANIAAHSGWFNYGGAMFNSALNIPGHTTIINRNPDASWITAHVSAGHPVIVGMNLDGGGTHFVTLTGMSGPSDYLVDDPWEQNAMHVTFSGDWFDRGPIYEAIAFI